MAQRYRSAVLRSAARLAKAGFNVSILRLLAMLAIGMIVAFILVIVGLNFYEFGRGD